jgi:uncharacterized protein YndB with AHSA1/START domain
MSDATRSVDVSLEIEAPPEAVWRALTEAQELTRRVATEAG